ncbi:MAG: bifunctional nuclease family protein [Treponema sp.]|jgi:bifunctional DNase/RNase|nr:bifunctional nuclease family protein [Treponema sp.]
MAEMLRAEIWTIIRTEQGNALLLRPLGSALSVPIFIGQLEVQSILIGSGDITVKRPLIHDLFLTLASKAGMTLGRVEVHELKNDTFHARVVLLGEGFSGRKPLILDARPSDALALAVRRKCPIFVSRKIVEQAGISVNVLVEDPPRDQPAGTAAQEIFSSVPEKRRGLEVRLEEAVAAEEYEKAAKIRDMLILLDEEGKKPV